MANPEHLRILERGVEEWNEWREKNPKVRPDLTNAGLSGATLAIANLMYADLSDADLSLANLTNANLSDADLMYADLSDADLLDADLTLANLTNANLTNADLTLANLTNAYFSDANLTSANLLSANLTNAHLSDADLSDADLSLANLTNAKLSNAKLKRAQLLGTHFHNLDLRTVEGLDLVAHGGPSPVSPQTMEMSKGRIPDVFLRGCGLKDWEILASKLHDPDLPPAEVTSIGYEIINLRTHAPIVPLSVFVSYAHEDKGFAEKIEQRLDKDGIRSWRDVHQLVAGPLERQIDRAITVHGAVLLILSEASVNSDWVRWEIERARKLEKDLEAEADGERRHRLCPVALDDSWKNCKWPGWLRSQIQDYNVLDFSKWESDGDAFTAQYEKLKTGLGIYYRK